MMIEIILVFPQHFGQIIDFLRVVGCLVGGDGFVVVVSRCVVVVGGEGGEVWGGAGQGGGAGVEGSG
jgi:hypothetical protein